MAKKKSLPFGGNAYPDAPRTVSQNGVAPNSRFRDAGHVWRACRELLKDDEKRSLKRTRLFNAFNRKPPTEYSVMIDMKMEGNSNVNWGLLAFIVNNRAASFIDMNRERTMACDITTKKGDPRERKIWSECIAYAYDQYALREWPGYMFNMEQGVQSMLLFGKGLELTDDDGTYESRHIPTGDLLAPNDIELNIENFEEMAIMRSYSLNQLWQKIEDKDSSESRGWNRDTVITAMRMCRKDWRQKEYTNERFENDIAQGNVVFSTIFKERVHVFEFYVKEYSGKISKHIVLQDYDPLISLVNETTGKVTDEDKKTEMVKDSGFLFTKTGFCDSIHEILSVFIDNVGSGKWHNTPSLAESVFVQCRQYDVIMNSIMDAIRLNMTLMLQGQTSDATNKLREVVWGQWGILPDGMPFAQNRIMIDTNAATNTLQYMMNDVYSGISQYQIQDKGQGGEQPTATQKQLDAAESARLTGSQIGRYNDQQTVYHRNIYKRFIKLTEGMGGYERFERFKEYLEEQGVPKEAWQWKNIDRFQSNMLAGAGSPSQKLMASNTIIGLTNMTAKDDGQRSAIEDGIAAVAGRQNVPRYLPPQRKTDPLMEERWIGAECEMFNDPLLNPKNAAVQPNDNHVLHMQKHMDDMASTILRVENSMKDNSITKEIAATAMTRLLNEGAHCTQHMNILRRDGGKQDMVKQFAKGLNDIQKGVQDLQANFQKVLAKQQQEAADFDPSKDPDVAKKIALGQIEVSTAEKIANIKASSLATSHELKNQITKDKAATEIAVTRAKAAATPPKKPKQ